MKGYLITFRSVTYAQRGEEALRRAGITAGLQRTSRWMEEQGCGYSLRLRAQDLQRAIELLRQKQIPFRKVYVRLENGDIEEVVL